MPVGIPKVPFLIPGDDDASWVDLYNRIYQERLLFLGQELNAEAANQLVGLMVYLSLQDKEKDLYLFINCPGGDVISGMAVFDAMLLVQAEVQTIAVGLAASMASVILVAGEVTKRLAFPHARVMIHQPASSLVEGQTIDCIKEANELLKMREMITHIYAQRTGRSFWDIHEDMERDFYMSAEEAKEYGIIDMIAESI
uniref:ATP-dependent Clp protease proteolytic subunit n=1 Tax=Astragalus neglectus TaxID=90195 RepID=A0A8K1JD08_9FABA|nr:clp protease proteolytic subunit [Astragalus neglectus]UCS40684.1 clp protease proteolytic subunit [Astragalus neglectus]